MKLPRRKFLHLAAGVAALPFVPLVATAQAYPSRPVRIIVTFAAGSANDVHGRLFGQWLAERLGQPFVVDNRPGGGGNLGVAEAVRSPPDGYTLFVISISHAVNADLYDKLPYSIVGRRAVQVADRHHHGAHTCFDRTVGRCPLFPRMCCKTIFTTKTRNIDSRTDASAQHRFKIPFSRI
jgi:hypothetical protein